MIYGYARVSTKEQNEERQLIALKEFGVQDKQIFNLPQERAPHMRDAVVTHGMPAGAALSGMVMMVILHKRNAKTV